MDDEPTLQIRVRNIATYVKERIGIVLLGVVIVGVVLFSTESSKLTCKRDNPGAPVNCVKQAILFWLIPLGEEEIREVLGARVVPGGGEDCSFCYRVELLTAQGEIPLLSSYTTGSSAKHDVENSINHYVRIRADQSLIVIEPGLFSADNIVLMLIMAGGLLLWRLIKLAFSEPDW